MYMLTDTFVLILFTFVVLYLSLLHQQTNCLQFSRHYINNMRNVVVVGLTIEAEDHDTLCLGNLAGLILTNSTHSSKGLTRNY